MGHGHGGGGLLRAGPDPGGPVTGGRRTTAVVAVVVLVVVVGAVAIAMSLSGPPAPEARPAAAEPDAHSPGAVTLAGTGIPGFTGDGGPAVDARLDSPEGVTVDRSGDLFIADTGNCRVREVAAHGGVSFGIRVRSGEIVTVAGGPCTGRDPHPAPTAVAVDASGDLFIAFGPAARVEELAVRTTHRFGRTVRAATPTPVAGTGSPGDSGDGGPAGQARLGDPTGLAVDPEGDLLIADTTGCRLRLVASATGSRYGTAVVEGHIYTVAGTGTCGSAGDGGPARSAQLWDPGALAVTTGGDVFIADQGNRTIRVLAATAGTFLGVPVAAGHVATVAGEGSYGPYLVDGLPALGETAELNFPTALAVDGRGNLSIADGAMHAIRLVPQVTTTLSGKPADAGDLYTAAGAEGAGSQRDGTTWVQTRLLQPSGLALSPGGGLIVSDSQSNVVREIPAGR